MHNKEITEFTSTCTKHIIPLLTNAKIYVKSDGYYHMPGLEKAAIKCIEDQRDTIEFLAKCLMIEKGAG
jgi:hypothetical protein